MKVIKTFKNNIDINFELIKQFYLIPTNKKKTKQNKINIPI